MVSSRARFKGCNCIESMGILTGSCHVPLCPGFLKIRARRENAAFLDATLGVGVVKSPMFETRLEAFDIQNSVKEYIPERVHAGKWSARIRQPSLSTRMESRFHFLHQHRRGKISPVTNGRRSQLVTQGKQRGFSMTILKKVTDLFWKTTWQAGTWIELMNVMFPFERNTWAMKNKTWLFRVYVGDEKKLPQLCGGLF